MNVRAIAGAHTFRPDGWLWLELSDATPGPSVIKMHRLCALLNILCIVIRICGMTMYFRADFCAETDIADIGHLGSSWIRYRNSAFRG